MKMFVSHRIGLAGLLLFYLFLFSSPAEARSWKEIQASGVLRILTVDPAAAGLHRTIMPIDRERILLKRFAVRNNLNIEYVKAPDFKALFSMLNAGNGDLISANLASTPQRKAQYLLSDPFDYTQEVVFTAERSPIRGISLKVLSGKTGWVLPGTTYEENMLALSRKIKEIKFRKLPMTVSHDTLIECVADGRYDYSVLNESDLDCWLAYRTDIRKLFAIRANVALVFAARKDSTVLINRLNQSLREKEFGLTQAKRERVRETAPASKIMKNDLPAIRRRGYIRVLTTNELFGCYLQKGQLCGFEYDLAKRFADSQKVALLTVIPVHFKDLARYLEEGRGDFIAANFTPSPERISEHRDLTFCAPYLGASQILVGRTGEKISGLDALKGRKVHVRKSETYYRTLLKIQARGIRFTIVPIPENEYTFLTLRKVASGEYDLTVVDDTFLRIAIDGGCRVKGLFPLTEKEPYTWVVRKNNPQLAAAINSFFKKENKSVFFNICRKRYYNSDFAKKTIPLEMKGGNKRLSPYDDLFRKYGNIYGFKWYFLAAQAYRESRFNPKRINHIGAAGLMQVMPKTAKEMGIRNLTNPENGIKAGAKYLAMLRDRFTGNILPADQLCFALASYNAGYGHVADARILAVKMGLNPNVWFKNTEKALALLEDPLYASRTKYGFCRASETIPYVRDIMLNSIHYGNILKNSTVQNSNGKQGGTKR